MGTELIIFRNSFRVNKTKMFGDYFPRRNNPCLLHVLKQLPPPCSLCFCGCPSHPQFSTLQPEWFFLKIRLYYSSACKVFIALPSHKTFSAYNALCSSASVFIHLLSPYLLGSSHFGLSGPGTCQAHFGLCAYELALPLECKACSFLSLAQRDYLLIFLFEITFLPILSTLMCFFPLINTQYYLKLLYIIFLPRLILCLPP